MEAIQELRGRWSRRMPHLNERQRRLMVAAEALVLSRRGISLVPQAAGLLGSTNHNAIAERDGSPLQGRIRRSGGGRKSFIELDGSTLDELEGLMAAESRADRMSPLQWTCRSTRQPAGGLKDRGHPVSHTVVAVLLRELGYRRQANATTIEGKQHQGRDAQLQYIKRLT